MSPTRLFTTAALLLGACAAPAFADNGFTPSRGERGGTYHPMPGGKTVAQVRAELERARADGSHAKMNSEAGYAPELETPSRQQLAQQPSIAGREGQIAFEAPAAGGRTRADVLRELQRAREDGSLRRMSTNRGF